MVEKINEQCRLIIMGPEEREEFKKQLLADLEETKRMVAETRRMADEMEATRLRVEASASAFDSTSESPLSTMHVGGSSLAEMRSYIDNVKKQFEAQRKYNRLPWWKRIFKERPSFG
jgi:hypothetical protein